MYSAMPLVMRKDSGTTPMPASCQVSNAHIATSAASHHQRAEGLAHKLREN